MSDKLDSANATFEQVVAEAHARFLRTGDKGAAQAFVLKADEVLARAMSSLAALHAGIEVAGG